MMEDPVMRSCPKVLGADIELANAIEIHVEKTQRFRRDACALADESQHEMCRGEIIMLEFARFEVGERHCVSRSI